MVQKGRLAVAVDVARAKAKGWAYADFKHTGTIGLYCNDQATASEHVIDDSINDEEGEVRSPRHDRHQEIRLELIFTTSCRRCLKHSEKYGALRDNIFWFIKAIQI